MRSTTEAARTTVRTIDLGHDQMLILDGRRDGGRDGRVRVLFGATWLTQEDEADDTFLRAGAELALHGGRTVIEGLEPTRLEIVERSAHRATRPVAWLQAAWRGVRQHITRLQLGPLVVQRGA